jgi:hypothetical protein
MPDILALTNFFQSTFNADYRSNSEYGAGYQASSLDILLQKSKRFKTVSENRIFDFIQVENDPNFGRKKNKSKYEGLISKLSGATSILTVFNAQTYMAGIHEFIPANLRSLLQNFQSISDTTINLIDNLQQQVIFKQIEEALFADLKLEFLGGTITFQEITNMANSIYDNLPLQDAVKNNGIRPLLSLGLQTFLPNSMVGIFDSLQYLDLLETIFINDTENSLFFTNKVKNKVLEYTEIEIQDTLIDPVIYEEPNLNYSDILGLALRDQFRSEIELFYQDILIEAVQTVGEEYEMAEVDRQALTDFLLDDANSNVEDAFRGTVALPELFDVVASANVESYNSTVSSLSNSFTLFIEGVISDLGIEPNTDSTKPLASVDYLINVKTNIRKRLEMKQRGATSEAFVDIEKYLSTVLVNKKITDDNLQDLNDRIDELLRERKETAI